MKEATVYEKSANLLIVIFLIIVGIVFLLLNFSFLPLLGFFIGLLFIIVGILFVAKHRRKLSQRNPPETTSANGSNIT
jgi:hypothetical protein